MSKVSVIIPSYNHEQFIPRAVDSVLGQTHQDLELIIIDDGSKDGSWEYLSSLADPRVTMLRQENAGAHNTINRGLDMATGEFLTVLNSDDEYTPDRLEILLTEFERDPQLSLLCSYIQIIDSKGENLGIKEGWHNCEPWPVHHPEKSYKSLSDFNKNLIMSNFVSTTSNMILRRKVYETVGGMRNLRFAHDWDFLLRVAADHKCTIIPRPLVRYRIHGTNTINTNRAWLLFETCLVVASNLPRFYGGDVFPTYTAHSVRECASLLGHSMNFQGNDKVYWMIKEYLEAMKSQGVPNPEELLMDDVETRQIFIEHVDAREADPPPPAIPAAPHGFKQKIKQIYRILKA